MRELELAKFDENERAHELLKLLSAIKKEVKCRGGRGEDTCDGKLPRRQLRSMIPHGFNELEGKRDNRKIKKRHCWFLYPLFSSSSRPLPTALRTICMVLRTICRVHFRSCVVWLPVCPREL